MSGERDQLWCVRSISLDDLHPDDVRGLLIRHCQAPARITESEQTASFDSDFERDVYRKIIARGYRVRTQYTVGRYRIDMVIEGAGGRLALELDGDAFHGPDRWDADRQRQAILERLGWTFHRIRGSAYYRWPEESLSSLWERLESLDIYPAGDRSSVLEILATPDIPGNRVGAGGRCRTSFAEHSWYICLVLA
ncbi:MAG: hypothetical protein JWM19_6484 [Actinomycetia bacterium]|nr:hypothetical protein [Actinomycetes bacterium]